MMLVQVQVGRSLIHGLGIFAVEPIAKGRPVWRFTPRFDLDLAPSMLDEQPSHFRQTMLHYGYIDIRLNRFILCRGDYRFVNHSDTPNIYVDVDADRYGVDVAARDIEAGEELTVGYALVEGMRPTGK
jgi:SET domain-containing protein